MSAGTPLSHTSLGIVWTTNNDSILLVSCDQCGAVIEIASWVKHSVWHFMQSREAAELALFRANDLPVPGDDSTKQVLRDLGLMKEEL